MVYNVMGRLVDFHQIINHELYIRYVVTVFRFGIVYGKFEMDNVECSGIEEGLDNCTYSDSHDCTASEGAGVVCIGNYKTNRINV